ncbi:MAG TPA: cytidine deaminase [Bacteroidetes bacterium]|nr:cytidine deaminase [Bacteroidota bacterium]
MNNWEELLNRSYSEYSRNLSACVVRGESGLLYPGVRIENASFPLTISASQSAMFSCLSEDDTPVEILVPPNFRDDRINYLSTYYKISVQTVDSIPNSKWFDPTVKEIIPGFESLKELQKKAIANESHFLVSCILESDNNVMISGVNIEFPDWQIGLCAERVALAKAISLGYSEIHSLHVGASAGEFISPCGACRQVLVEHLPYKIINLYHPDGTKTATTAAQLLPAFFNGSSLRI